MKGFNLCLNTYAPIFTYYIRVENFRCKYEDIVYRSGDLKNCFNIFSLAIQSQLWFKSLKRLKNVSPSIYISPVLCEKALIKCKYAQHQYPHVSAVNP